MYFVCITVVSYYDLNVLSMPVMGFQNKVLIGGWLDGVSSIEVFVGFF